MSVINVLYPFDNNYATYAGVSLTSLLENNKEADEINVYILGFGLSADNQRKFENTVKNYGRKLIFLDCDRVSSFIDDLNMPSYRGASVAVARLFISRYLPDDVEKIVYLDSDTIVVGNLSELFDEELNGKPVGMVCDSVGRDYKRCIGFLDDEDYYNAGVILYDMNRWRELKCSERILDHIRNVRNNYESLDQDLIDIVLKDQVQRLNLKYNLQPFHVVYDAKTYLKVYGDKGYYSKTEIEQAASNPVILHAFRYLGMFPWHKDSSHPEVGIYNDYKSRSQWNDNLPVECGNQGLVLNVERILIRILPRECFLCLFSKVFYATSNRKNKRLINGEGYNNI